MAISDAQKIGQAIGEAYYEQDIIKENMSGEDAAGEISTFNSENIEVTGTIVATQYDLASDSFVLDHVIYGELDSAVFKLDGGYESSSSQSFPATFPWSFETGGDPTVLFSGPI